MRVSKIKRSLAIAATAVFLSYGYAYAKPDEPETPKKELTSKEKVYQQEKEHKFVPLEGMEGGLSDLKILIAMIANNNLIEAMDESKLEKINDEYKPLKELMIKLDSIHYNNTYTKKDKLERMYQTISDAIPERKLTPGAEGIENLVRDGAGDCNDIVPAYFSLLNYYGIETCIRVGKSINKEGEKLHTWLTIIGLEKDIELDPTWYWTYTEIEERNNAIKCNLVKDKFMRYKE